MLIRNLANFWGQFPIAGSELSYPLAFITYCFSTAMNRQLELRSIKVCLSRSRAHYIFAVIAALPAKNQTTVIEVHGFYSHTRG